MDNMDLPENSADMIIANHCLFYANDMQDTLNRIKKVLKKDGVFICSTYGSDHMKEISELVMQYDDRIVLAAKDLYKIFGKTNGGEILGSEFNNIEWKEYEDSLYVTEAEDLINYIISCHGNQNQYILDDFKEFKSFVKSEMGKGFYVTKEAGIFICRK
jgi:SAM-dependent methyltransferase